MNSDKQPGADLAQKADQAIPMPAAKIIPDQAANLDHAAPAPVGDAPVAPAVAEKT